MSDAVRRFGLFEIIFTERTKNTHVRLCNVKASLCRSRQEHQLVSNKVIRLIIVNVNRPDL